MSIFLGHGATATKNAVNVANLISMDHAQSEGAIRGSKQSDVTIEIQVDTATAPYLHGDIDDWVITPGTGATWTMTLSDAEITAVSTPIQRDKAVTQSISLRCFVADPYA